MKEVLGSLPEVITAYKNYNLLVPTATDVQLNPFYKFHVEEVPVDLGENSGDIFKVGSVKTGKQDEKGKDIWEDVFSLSKPLLNKMAMAAGIQFNPKETYGERIDRVTYRAQAQGAMRKADGTARTETDRMTSISSFDTENVIAPLNANANAGNEELKGYQVAAYIAGVVAATPANQSVTHATLSRYSVLNEILTNTEMEVAEEKGCLVLSTASDGAVWLDNGVNTLVHPDANHDSGWKKIRRTKTRYELLNRANAAADALVGKVDNDTNGRATIMAAIQGICNAMEAEGKIQYGNVTESTTVTTDGDTCGFDIEVIDLDSAEHIYLNYYFQFSTIVAASGE